MDEEEYAFLKALDDKEEAREKKVKDGEREGVKFFKMQQAKMNTIQHEVPASTHTPAVKLPKKDVQKEVLNMIKKRGAADPKQPSPHKKVKASLVADYASSSDSDSG